MNKNKRDNKTEVDMVKRVRATKKLEKEQEKFAASAPEIQTDTTTTPAETTPEASEESVWRSIENNITQMCAQHDASDYGEVITNVICYISGLLNDGFRHLYAQAVCTILHDRVVVHLPDTNIPLFPYKDPPRYFTIKDYCVTVSHIAPGVLRISAEYRYFSDNTEIAELSYKTAFIIMQTVK